VIIAASTHDALLASLLALAFALFLRFAIELFGLRVTSVEPFFCLLAACRVIGFVREEVDRT